MIGTLSVTTTAQTLISGGNRDGSGILIIENNSDTDWYLAIGEENIKSLTTSNGFTVKAGKFAVLDRKTGTRDIGFIHGGSGSKSGRYQYA